MKKKDEKFQVKLHIFSGKLLSDLKVRVQKIAVTERCS